MRTFIKRKYEIDIIAILLLIIPLFIFSINRGLDSTPDTRAYLKIYSNIVETNGRVSIEPSFSIISSISYRLFGFDDGFRFLLSFYAFSSFSLLIYIILKYSNMPFISAWLYISIYFLLHICVTIRVGIAALIFLLALEDIINRNIIMYYLKSIVCIFFHASGVIMLVLYPLLYLIINKKTLLFILPIIGYILSYYFFILIEIASNYFPNRYIAGRLHSYIFFFKKGSIDTINIFNIYYLLIIFIYYLLLVKIYHKLSVNMKIYHAVLCLSIFSFCFGRSLPVVAYRIPEFLNIVLILFIPKIYKYIKEKKIYITIIFLFSIYMIYLYTLKNPVIKLY
jgi:hypothetical protein